MYTGSTVTHCAWKKPHVQGMTQPGGGEKKKIPLQSIKSNLITGFNENKIGMSL